MWKSLQGYFTGYHRVWEELVYFVKKNISWQLWGFHVHNLFFHYSHRVNLLPENMAYCICALAHRVWTLLNLWTDKETPANRTNTTAVTEILILQIKKCPQLQNAFFSGSSELWRHRDIFCQSSMLLESLSIISQFHRKLRWRFCFSLPLQLQDGFQEAGVQSLGHHLKCQNNSLLLLIKTRIRKKYLVVGRDKSAIREPNEFMYFQVHVIFPSQQDFFSSTGTKTHKGDLGEWA